MYFGTALLGAHRLELAQEWAGCVIGPEALRRFSGEIPPLLEEGLLVQYPCPIKPNTKLSFEPTIVLNWAYYQTGLGDRATLLRDALANAPAEAKRKVEHTQSFLNFLSSHNLASKATMTKRGFRIDSKGRGRAI